ncbi:unnamed protein product [Caenorhabditis bovis]|uniref:Uncharacterized protein n=1 Tax=Caenorhabditis bovis TaxID=2654633 RepID=A0A8S1EZ64_9PELO|nr:unnamed protein product [Caenorhabditis bovis]
MDNNSMVGFFTIQYSFVGFDEILFPVYSDDIYWCQEVPYAIFIAIYCTFFMILQIMVTRAILMDKEMRRLPAYQIMIWISVFDFLQLIAHIIPVYYILDSKPHFGVIDFLVGAIMNASWVTMLLLSIFLNINRFLSIVFHFSTNRFFSKNLMKVYLSIFVLIWFSIAVINSTSLSHFVYLLPTYTYHYVADYEYSHVIRAISADISLIDVIVSMLSHAFIFTFIYFKASILSKREFFLSLQVLCTSIFHVLGYITWEYIPIPWDLSIGLFLGHFIWMVWNSVNPALYILINPRIRHLVFNSVGIKNYPGSVVIVNTQLSAVKSSTRS